MQFKRIAFLALFAMAINATAQGVYQLPNSNFEQWDKTNEPSDWNSFESATGSQSGFGKSLTKGNTTKVAGRNGGQAASIVSAFAGFWGIGANANGNLTTGRINMGSSTPENAANHNFSDVSSAEFSKRFVGLPDSVEFYTKFKAGKDNKAKAGQATFILHNKFNFKNPHETAENTQAYQVAEAVVPITESTDWQRNVQALTYSSLQPQETYMLASFTTNPKAGESISDNLTIDDLHFIYNSTLKTCVYDAENIAINDTITINKPYEESKLQLTPAGIGATIEKSYDETSGKLTLIIKGNDISVNPSNTHTYTLQFTADNEQNNDTEEIDQEITYPILSISFGGLVYINFVPEVYQYEVPHVYSPSLVVDAFLTPGATLIEHTTKTGAKTKALYDDEKRTITVIGELRGEKKTYTFSFRDAKDATIESITNTLLVELIPKGGEKQKTLTENVEIKLIRNFLPYTNFTTYNLVLNNFSFNGVPVGDIFIPNILMEPTGKIEKQIMDIRILSFDKQGNPDYTKLGWSLGTFKVSVEGDIGNQYIKGNLKIEILTESSPILADMFEKATIYYGDKNEITNIKSVTTAKQKVVIYNLQGVKLGEFATTQAALNALPKGVFLIDGKKIVNP